MYIRILYIVLFLIIEILFFIPIIIYIGLIRFIFHNIRHIRKEKWMFKFFIKDFFTDIIPPIAWFVFMSTALMIMVIVNMSETTITCMFWAYLMIFSILYSKSVLKYTYRWSLIFFLFLVLFVSFSIYILFKKLESKIYNTKNIIRGTNNITIYPIRKGEKQRCYEVYETIFSK